MQPEHLIFFDEKPFYITSQLTPSLQHLAARSSTIMLNQPQELLLKKVVQDIQHTRALAAIVLTHHPDMYWQYFQTLFTPIAAAGGVVQNDAGELLFIFRRGKWDLPKGKWDEGETIEACALREVMEETGIRQATITQPLTCTCHTYQQGEKNLLKTTWWFAMHAPGKQATQPQKEEDIEAINWVAPYDQASVLSNTYASIRWLMQHLPASITGIAEGKDSL